MTDVIDIAGLVKRFGCTTALDGLDLGVTRGDARRGGLSVTVTAIAVLNGSLSAVDPMSGLSDRSDPPARRGRQRG